ncbi:MAG: AsmA-like C-terminal domain-containing protein [Desulfobacterium sp.]|nr:AsmA-like C-terminal domain-containing protein [Desulfobacterium sp.]
MTPKEKSFKRPLLFITLFVIICVTGLMASLPWIVDSAFVKHEISTFLSKRLHATTTTHNIDFKFFPRPLLTIQGLGMDIKGRIRLSVNETLLYPDVLNLAMGKIDINKICFKTVLASQVDAKTAIKRKQPGLPPLMEISEPALFSLLPETQNDLAVVVENFQSDLFARMDASFMVSPKTRRINGEALIRDLKLGENTIPGLSLGETITSVTSERVKIQFSYTQSTFLTLDLELVSPKILLKNPKAPEISGQKITARAVLTKERIAASIDPIQLDSPKLDCAIDFTFDRKTKRSAITFKGTNVNIDQTRSAALELLKSDEVCQEIFWILRSGLAPSVTVSFNSDSLKDLFDPEAMVITGFIIKGGVRIPETVLTVSNIQGTVTMAKGILHTDVTNGRVEGALIRKGTLDVDILGDHNAFEGEFDLSADLSRLPRALKKLLPDTLLAKELDRCDRIQGKAEGVLHLKKGNGDLSVWVKATEISLDGEYNRIPGNMHIIAKEFTYEADAISVNNMNGASDMGTFSNVTGSVTLGSTPFLTIETAGAQLDLSRFFPWLTSFNPVQTALFPIKSALGKLKVDRITMEGPVLTPEKWQYDVTGDLADLDLGTANSKAEIYDAACDFRVSHQTATLTNMAGTVTGPGLVSSLTKVPYIDELAMPLTLSKGFFSTGEGTPEFKGQLTFDRETDLFLNIKGTPDAYVINRAELREKDRTNAQLSIQEDRLNFLGNLDTRTLEPLLAPGSLILKRLLSLTQGKHFSIESNIENSITVVADFIDLDTIKTPGAETKKEPVLKQVFSKPITLKAKAVKYKGYIFSPVEARVSLNGPKTDITIVHARCCTLDGTGTMVNNDGAIDIKAAVDIPKGDLNKTFSCIWGKKNLIKGEYSLKANLHASGSAETVAGNVQGPVDLTSQGGRIYKLTLLSRILSVVNISALFSGKLPDIEQNGFAYTSLTVDADVKDSRIVLNSAVIDGADMTLIFTGWIDPVKQTMELTCLVAPFKTADILIEKIPILGTILNGRLISIPVKAVGNLHDPKVFLLPPSEVGKGLVGTMQRILETPFKLIEKLPNN